MRVLITGGTGFIGSNLVKLALAKNVEVTVIDNFATSSRENLEGLDVRLVEGSILDSSALDNALTNIDSVVHLAALPSVPRSIADPMASHAANATGTLAVLEHARSAGVNHVIVASSSSVYGLNLARPKNEREWVRPMSPYAVSKLATEQYALAYQQSFGMKTTAFRFFNVYGPGQTAGHAYAAVIPAFIEALLANQHIPMQGDGTQSRDFTYVGTVCRILLDACERKLSHVEPVNLAFGTNTTLNELVKILASVTGRRTGVDYGESRLGDVKHSQADNQVLRALFPEIEPVPLDAGVAETVAWFEKSQSNPLS